MVSNDDDGGPLSKRVWKVNGSRVVAGCIGCSFGCVCVQKTECHMMHCDPEGQPLHYTQIISAMEGTHEIFKGPDGIVCIGIDNLIVVQGI